MMFHSCSRALPRLIARVYIALRTQKSISIAKIVLLIFRRYFYTKCMFRRKIHSCLSSLLYKVQNIYVVHSLQPAAQTPLFFEDDPVLGVIRGSRDNTTYISILLGVIAI